MSDLTKEELLQLALEVGGEDLVTSVEERLEEEENHLGARKHILGHLDGRVMKGNPPDPAKAAEYYRRLGFTTEERVGFRQRNLL